MKKLIIKLLYKEIERLRLYASKLNGIIDVMQKDQEGLMLIAESKQSAVWQVDTNAISLKIGDSIVYFLESSPDFPTTWTVVDEKDLESINSFRTSITHFIILPPKQ